MAEFKRGLGRRFNPKGLEALIDIGSEEFDSENKNESGITEVDIMKIQPNRSQPRKKFNDESISELCESIKQVGIIQPLVVIQTGEFYEIVAGERRYRAARLAGIEKVPVIIKKYSELEILQTALIENIQREDLNPVDEAMTYKKFNEEFSLSQEEIAKKVGKSRSAVANSMRLLKLGENVLDMLRQGELSVGHCKVLLGIEDEEEQKYLADKIISENMSVRQTETMVNEAALNLKNKDKANDNNSDKPNEPDNIGFKPYEYFEKQASAIVGAKVRVRNSGKVKKVVFEFYSDDEIDGFLGLLKNAGITEEES